MSLHHHDPRAVSATASAAAGRLPRWWRASVGVLTIAVALCCLVTVVGVLHWVEAILGMAGMFALLCLAPVWLVLLVIGLIGYPGRRRAVLRWALPAVVIAAVTVPLISEGPKLQFAVSRGALEHAAEQCRESSSPSWAGAVRLERAERVDGHCHLFQYGSFFGESGWVLLPDGPPAQPVHGMSYRHLDGAWHRFSYDPY